MLRFRDFAVILIFAFSTLTSAEKVAVRNKRDHYYHEPYEPQYDLQNYGYENYDHQDGYESYETQEVQPQEPKTQLQERTWDFSDFDWVSYFDGLYSPTTFGGQVAIATTMNWFFRTISYMIAAGGYFLLLNITTGETRSSIQALDYFFNRDTFMQTIGRNLRNWSMILFGRVMFALIFYGPKFTLESFANITPESVISFPFTANRTRLFVDRFVIEGIGSVAGWLLYSAIVQSMAGSGGKKKKRSVEDDFPKDVSNVDGKIKDDFDEVLKSLVDPTIFSFF